MKYILDISCLDELSSGAKQRFLNLYSSLIKTNNKKKFVIIYTKFKEVRKIFEAVGLTVSRLKRVRYGPIFLPSTLAESKCRELTENEIISLKKYGQQS